MTERWHHQQQIRLATNRPDIMMPELYAPVLDCFVRALPHLSRDVDAPVGTIVLLEISRACGGEWFLSKGADRWQLSKSAALPYSARVTIPQEIAWRLFTKGMDRDMARHQIVIEGNDSGREDSSADCYCGVKLGSGSWG